MAQMRLTRTELDPGAWQQIRAAGVTNAPFRVGSVSNRFCRGFIGVGITVPTVVVPVENDGGLAMFSPPLLGSIRANTDSQGCSLPYILPRKLWGPNRASSSLLCYRAADTGYDEHDFATTGTAQPG